MKKVLLYASKASRINPYVEELESIFHKIGVKPILSDTDFWEKTGNYQVIIFQWPEELVHWHIPSDKEIEKLNKTLLFWADKSKIIVTRHNIIPHHCDGSDQYKKLYTLMYSFADAVIHLGEFSKKQYLKTFHDNAFINKQLQVVIPHPIYTSFKNNTLQDQARSFLKLPKNKKIILVFGHIRKKEELILIHSTFSKLNKKKYYLKVYVSGRGWSNLKSF